MRKICLSHQEIKRILIVNLGGIGDFLLSQPALLALRNNYKGAHIVFLTAPRTVPIAEGSPYLDEVLLFDFRFWKAIGSIRILRGRSFDLAINMRSIVSWMSAFKMALLFYLIKPKYKVGRDTNKRGFFFDVKIPEEEVGDLPEYEYDLMTVEALGIRAESRAMRIEVSEEDVSYINDLQSEYNIKEDDLVIGINHGAPYPAKRWPVEKFAALVRLLKEKINCKVIITGSYEEIESARKIQALSDSEVVIMAGRTSIKQLAALIKRCDLFISNDTGPMHMAAILKVPQIAIFAGGYLPRFDPRNISDKAVVFHNPVDCSPCDRYSCKSMQCLNSITPQEVCVAAIGQLRENK